MPACILQEDGRVNLCLSVAGRAAARLGRDPRLADRPGARGARFGERLAETGDQPWLSISNVP
jgi:hypothetical protein